MSYQDLNFDGQETALIAQAWAEGVLDWNNKALQGIRSKIRNLHREILKDRCCYCRKHFMDDHPLAVDIEHVLPKSKFKSLAISPVNLTVACKRCNMTIKKDRIDFLNGLSVADLEASFESSDAYEIIHPNLDNYHEHIKLDMVSINESTLCRYRVKDESKKGLRTVEYFELRSLEVDNLDEIQGIDEKSGSQRAAAIRDLLGV